MMAWQVRVIAVATLVIEASAAAQPANDARRFLEALEHRFGHDRGQAERHFVGDDEPRRDGQGARQGKHLLLSTREAARPLRAPLAENGKQPYGPIDGVCPFAPLLLGDGHTQVVHHGEKGQATTIAMGPDTEAEIS